MGREEVLNVDRARKGSLFAGYMGVGFVDGTEIVGEGLDGLRRFMPHAGGG